MDGGGPSCGGAPGGLIGGRVEWAGENMFDIPSGASGLKKKGKIRIHAKRLSK